MSSDRDKFLVEYYKKCWDNISRAEEAAWKMMAGYATLLAGLSFVYNDIGSTGFLLIIIIFSFFSASLSMNANLWFVRNIGLITNFEKEFLRNEDYGYLIPKSYRKKIPFFHINPEYWEAWWIHTFTYLIICIIFIILLRHKITIFEEKLSIIGTFTGGLFWIIYYGYVLNKRHEKFRNDAPGKKELNEE